MYKCYDCSKTLKVKDKEILDGFQLVYEHNGEKIIVFKCKECYEKDPSLRNFQKCGVYSRVVGYLRPVQEWNIGKKAEYKDKKIYKL